MCNKDKVKPKGINSLGMEVASTVIKEMDGMEVLRHMQSNEIEISRNGPILEIMLQRPKANAIDTACSFELWKTFRLFQEDSRLRVAIITGKGETFFSAGWDLKAGESVDADHGPGGFAGITELFQLNKPIIAAVNGMAVGGGFELALACDLILCSEATQFFLPEVKIGIIPDAGGVLRLPKRLPRAIAIEMLLTGKRLDAQTARDYGLVNKIVPVASLMNEAREMANEIITGAPIAVKAIKEVMNETEHLSVLEGYQKMRSNSLPTYKQMLESKDAKEGQQAFHEKRNPIWRGE